MMISVNLRPGSKRASRSGSPFAGAFASLRGLGTVSQDPFRLLAIGAWIAVLGFLGWVFIRTSTQLGQLEPRLEQAQAEHRRFQEFIRQKQREEATRDSILAQIETIQQVDAERYVWPRVLDEIARAVPAYTWLVDVSRTTADPMMAPDTLSGVAPVAVQVTGRTADIQGYTRLMRELENSPWLRNVTAVSANTVVEQGRAITAFVLKVLYTRPDPSQIPSVPVDVAGVR